MPLLQAVLGINHPILSTVPHIALETLECGFKGDDNIYGLGIRLAFYIQWVCTFLVSIFLPQDTRSMWDVSTSFTFSMFVALIYVITTRAPSELYAAEVLIILSLCGSGSTCCLVAGGVVKMSRSGNPIHILDSPSSIVASLFKASLDIAINSFSIWYWFVGIDHMARSPCSTSAFFLAKVDIYHWFRTYSKAAFAIAGVGMCLGLVFGTRRLIHPFSQLGLWKLLAVVLGFNKVTPTQPRSPTELKSRISRSTVLSLGILSLLLSLFVLGVELPIRWNHHEGVGTVASTGQLIPLVVAITSLVTVIHRILVDCVTRTSKPEVGTQQDAISEDHLKPQSNTG